MQVARRRGSSYIGTVLGEKYRLESPVGEGGMATVWLARHLTLDRPVAVKFVHIAGDPGDVRERFLREARVAAAVRHRHVVDILDFGATDEGRSYMVMEYLEGETLRERLDRAPPLPVGDAVRIVARSLSGLAAVHDAGIVHRDIKPGNIFLVRDADGIFPKLLDFGVSRAAATLEVESVLPSTDNAITGTPQYMAPEQARGMRDIDHRADLYGMGVVLYEALTGKPPFDCEQIGDLIMMILTMDPVPLAELRPDLGEPLSRVIARALARERGARFHDAREMRQALLDAAARTALELAGSRESPGGPDSVFPAAVPQELMDAVGSSYEPGDSRVLPASSIPTPGARRSEVPTVDAPLPKPPRVPGDAQPERRSKLPWLVLLVLVAAGAGAWVVQGMPGWPRDDASPDAPTAAAPEPRAAPEMPEPAAEQAGAAHEAQAPEAAPVEEPEATAEEPAHQADEGTAAADAGAAETQRSPTARERRLERRRLRRLRRQRRQRAGSEMIFTDPGF